jgi:hypothetical protein
MPVNHKLTPLPHRCPTLLPPTPQVSLSPPRMAATAPLTSQHHAPPPAPSRSPTSPLLPAFPALPPRHAPSTTSAHPPPVGVTPISSLSETVECASLTSSVRQGSLEVFLSLGRHDVAAAFAFVRITPQLAVSAPAPFIREAIRAAFPLITFEVLPSSFGSLLVRFQSAGDCTAAVSRSPLLHEDVAIFFERHDGRSVKQPVDVLAVLSVHGFPLTFWHEEFIRQAFQVFCSVVEVDWRCTSGLDYSSVRVVVRVEEVTSIPADLCIHDSSSGDSFVCQVKLVDSWPLPVDYGQHGTLRPYFGWPPHPVLPPPAPTPHRTTPLQPLRHHLSRNLARQLTVVPLATLQPDQSLVTCLARTLLALVLNQPTAFCSPAYHPSPS